MFDQWTRRVAPAPRARRSLLRLGVGGGLGLLGFGHVADDALACVKTGKECRRGKPNGNCCSGTCKRGRCRPTLGAKGCQVNSGDICRNDPEPCPNNPNGNCAQLDNGKPFCFETFSCEPCPSHAECTSLPGGKCIRTCPLCNTDTGGLACVYPVPL